MSGSPLASLFVALGLDASAFDKGIDEAGAKTDSLGKKGISAGQVFSGGMVAIGAGLGVVTGAAMQAERAQGDFMAATGASRDEAKQFVSGMDSLAGSAGAVGKSFSDIAGAGSLIAQQMGTTGDETTKLTGQILTFAKVTKTDVSTAITGLDDAMDSWNLTADQTGNVMDVVTAGVQEFGGTAQDSLGLLNTLAPSLQAANMQWDDAAGLINLFNRAGVDASVTATAFNKVLTKVKSPEELQQLVADIAATKDPFDRAQKAAAAFGTKAGPKLALALADSGGDLTKFKIKIGDATGAVDDAGEAMLTTGDRIHGMVDKMMAGAREVGQQFGPALTGAASLASLSAPLLKKMLPLGKALGTPLAKGLATTFSTGLTSVLGSLSSNSALTGGMDTIGKSLGGRLGTALKGAAALGLAGLAVEMLPGLMAEWDKIRLKLEDIGHQTSETAGKSTDEIIAAVAALHKVPDSFDPLKRGIFELSAALPFALGDAKNTWGRSLSELEGELRARGVDVDKALADYASGAAATVDSTATLTPDAIDRASEANTAALDGAATDVSASFDQYVTKWEDGSAALRIAGQQLAEFDPDTEAWSLGKDFAAASADTQAGITAWIAAQTSSIDQAGLAIYGAIERYVTKFKDGSAAIRVAGTDLAVFDPDSGLWKADDDILKASGDTADAVEVWIEKQNGVWDAASSALGTSLADVRGKITEGLSGIQDAFDLGLDTKKRKNVSGTQRLKQMADDIDKITKNLHDSIKANDPVNTAYWESALINATGKYDAARQSINVDAAAISTDLSNAGVSMKHDWTGIGKDSTKGKNKINAAAADVNFHPAATNVGAAADDIRESMHLAGQSAMSVAPAISHARGPISTAARHIVDMIAGIFDVDFYSAGQHMIFTWSKGMWGSRQAVARVANKLAHIPADYLKFSAPPPFGPLHGIRSWGPHMIDEWLRPILPHGLGKVGSASYKLADKWASGLRDNIFNSLSDLEAGTNDAALGKAAQHLAARMRQGHGHKGAADAMFEALSEFEAHGASKRQGAEAAALAKLLRKWAAPDEPDPTKRHRSADWHDTAAPIGHRHDRRDRHRPAADDRGDTGGDVYNITVHGNIYGQGGIKQLAADLDRYRTRSTRGGRRLVGSF